MVKRVFGLFLLLALALSRGSAIAGGCTEQVDIFGGCVACGEGSFSYRSDGAICDYCYGQCIKNSPIKSATESPPSCSPGDPAMLKRDLSRRLQFVVDADSRTLTRVAEINPLAAFWLARQSPDLSAIAKGDYVNIEEGNSYARGIATAETIRQLTAGITDMTVLAPTFMAPPSGQVVFARYSSAKQADGTIRVHFESALVSPETKTTVAPLYPSMTFVLGPDSRQLDASVPGRPEEKLQAFPVTGWEVPTNMPHVFRNQE